MFIFKECRHIKTNGLKCKSPAMRGSAYCYFHARRFQPYRRGAHSVETRIEVPELLEGKGLAHAISQVLQALGNSRISPRRAAVLLYGLQMAAGDSAYTPCGAEEISEQDLISQLSALLHKTEAKPTAPKG